MFFNFALKFESVNEFFRGQKIMELFLNLSFFFDATAIYRDADRRKKVHRVVLIYSVANRHFVFLTMLSISLFIIRTLLSNFRFLITAPYLVFSI